MSQYLKNFFSDMHDTPRFQQLIASVNNNLTYYHGKTPMKNKSALVPFLFEVLRTLPLDLPPFVDGYHVPRVRVMSLSLKN